MRIDFIDNLKGLLIFFVVLGHVLLPIADNGGGPLASVLLYQSIYLFHMPLFIFVSGFLAKRVYTPEKGLRIEKTLSLFLLALLFQACVITLDDGPQFVLEKLAHMKFGTAPWYLFSLATWYLLTPALYRVRAVPGIVIAFAIGLLAGYIPEVGKTFSLMRTLMFLPFFVLGYYCSRNLLQKIISSKALFAIAAAAAVFLVAYWMTGGSFIAKAYPLAYASKPYPNEKLIWIARHALIYGIGVLLSLGLMALCPKKRVGLLAYLGTATLQIYVFHRLVRSCMEIVGMYDLPIVSDPLLGPLFLVVVAVVLTAACAIPWLGKPLSTLLSIKWTRILAHAPEK